jgi:long-chain acyl-CoA synthetase
LRNLQESAREDTLFGAVAASAAKRPDKVALRMKRDGRWVEVTYSELLARAKAQAMRLRELGIRPGDRVALHSENRPEWAISYLSIVECGATAVPLDAQLRGMDLEGLLEAADVRAVIASPHAVQALSGDYRNELSGRGVPLLDLADELSLFEGSAVRCGRTPSDGGDPTIASLIFTSGTMGRPKGVLLSHESLIFDADAIMAQSCYCEESDELLSVLPLHHTFEFTVGLLIPLFHGASVTYVEAIRRDLLLATLQERHCTIMLVVPRLLELLHAGIQRRIAESGFAARAAMAVLGGISQAARGCGLDLSRRLFRRVHQGLGGGLRHFVCGAAPLPPEVWSGFEKHGLRIVQGYGLSETAPAVAVTPLDERRPGTVGPPLPGIEIRIGNPDEGGVGEILIRGKNVMRGYFRDPEGTAAVLRDGWFHSGDLGRFDGRGHLVITGRIKDLIVTAVGKNVSPPDVERRFAGVAGVKELCVFGAPTASLDEEVHGAIVLDPEAFPRGTSELERRREVTARLAARASAADIPSYMRVVRWWFLDDLPKTTTLKVKRFALRAMAAAGGDPGRARQARASAD